MLVQFKSAWRHLAGNSALLFHMSSKPCERTSRCVFVDATLAIALLDRLAHRFNF